MAGYLLDVTVYMASWRGSVLISFFIVYDERLFSIIVKFSQGMVSSSIDGTPTLKSLK